MDATSLMLGMLFGSVGIGFWIYGKREQRLMPLLAGVALMVFPFFMPNNWSLCLVGVGLCALPFVVHG